MHLYSFFPTPHFNEKMERIKKHDPPGHERIWKVIHRLLAHPGDADGKMHGLHHGRLKKYVGRRDYRLIYHWCRECRKENLRLEDKCGHCEEIDDHSVIFFDVYHKNEINKF